MSPGSGRSRVASTRVGGRRDTRPAEEGVATAERWTSVPARGCAGDDRGSGAPPRGAAVAPAKVILFGSHAHGRAGPDSDLDLLVLGRVVGSRHAEMVRLRAALDPLRVPADVIVVSEQHVEDWGEVPGTVVHAALSEGRLLAET